MDPQESRHFATQVALGWMLFFMIKVFALSASILFGIYDGDGFRTLLQDPGPEAARGLLYAFWLVSMLPIYVFVVDRFESDGWRWPVVFMGGALFALDLHHHWNHWVGGDRDTFTSNIVDFMASGAALWIVCSAVAWARCRARARRASVSRAAGIAAT